MVRKITRHPATLAALALVLALSIVSTIAIAAHYRKKPLIPVVVRKAVTYTIFVPNGAGDYSLKTPTLNYVMTTQQLSYHLKNTAGSDVLLSMQPSPESFSDVPQVYEALVGKLNQYASFDSVQGRVFLTRPKELNGAQSAVMNAKGTLLFARPSKDLTEDQWRSFFAYMVVYQ